MSKQKKVYHPESGDICYLNMDPQLGMEQSKRRPVLVISDGQFNEKLGLAFVCPITSTEPRHAFHLKLGKQLTTKGTVMVEQLKSLDYMARNAVWIEKAPEDIVLAAIDIIKKILP